MKPPTGTSEAVCAAYDFQMRNVYSNKKVNPRLYETVRIIGIPGKVDLSLKRSKWHMFKCWIKKMINKFEYNIHEY